MIHFLFDKYKGYRLSLSNLKNKESYRINSNHMKKLKKVVFIRNPNSSSPTFLNVNEPGRHFSCGYKEAFQVADGYEPGSQGLVENKTQTEGTVYIA